MQQVSTPKWSDVYRNIIACSSPGKRIFIYYEKRRFASQKTEFIKKIKQESKDDPKWLRNDKMLQKLIYYILICLSS